MPLTGVAEVGVGGAVVLRVVIIRESVLIPVSNETLRVERVLVHDCLICF